MTRKAKYDFYDDWFKVPDYLGLQVPYSLGNEISLSGIVWGRWSEVSRVVARNFSQQRNDNLCGSDQQGSCAYADRNPPRLSVSKAVQFLKGKSSHKMLSEFPQLKKKYWGQHLWARGYWVASSGNVTDEVWKAYIENQKPNEPDDDFSVL